MFGKTKCKQCGMILEAESALKRSGNLFCSEEHAQEYMKKSEDKHGCCC